jgi:hypothetical protein
MHRDRYRPDFTGDCLFAKKSISRIVSVLFILASLPGLASQTRVAYAAPQSLSKPMKHHHYCSSPLAGMFTSQGMYAATGSHALHVDFIGWYHHNPWCITKTCPCWSRSSILFERCCPLHGIGWSSLIRRLSWSRAK